MHMRRPDQEMGARYFLRAFYKLASIDREKCVSLACEKKARFWFVKLCQKL
jgi:hypothetical protein